MEDMKQYKPLILLLLINCIGLSSCKKYDPDPTDDPKYSTSEAYTLSNISYGSDGEQKMDIYLPKDRSATTTKVFVLIHGGCWSSGYNSGFSSVLNNLKNTYPDYAVINLNYRLGTVNNPGYPKQIEDIQKALSEIQKTEYTVSNEYFFYGISAGAHLSLLYGYAFDPNHEVKGICNVVGPSEFADSAYTNSFTESYITPFLVGTETINQNPALFDEVSPAKQVTANAPPTISFYGGADTFVPSSQLTLLHDQLDDFGVYNESTLYPTKTHTSWTQAEINDFTTKLGQFLETYF